MINDMIKMIKWLNHMLKSYDLKWKKDALQANGFFVIQLKELKVS